MNQIIRFLPALRVHSWGGLGSQLFTAHLILKLKHRFPRREIKLILHTAGVTRREAEFDFTTLGVQVKQIEDFNFKDQRSRGVESFDKVKTGFFYLMKNLGLLILRKFHFIISADNEANFASLRIWTFMIRGHYTQLILEKDTVRELYELMSNKVKVLSPDVSNLIVHCRLGDLLKLSQKSPIDALRLDTLLNNLNVSPKSVLVVTDSSFNDFIEYATGTRILSNCQYGNFSSFETLKRCIFAKEFIGTSAKLSLWAAIFRYYLMNVNSYLPKDLIWIENAGLKATWY
jgi:hypothetical protein